MIAWYACQRLGAVAVGNNPLYTQRELAHQIKDFSPSVMVVLDQLYPAWAAVADEAPVREVIVTELTDYMRFPLNLLAPIKFKKDAKHEGKPWPPVPPDAPVRWWKDAVGVRRIAAAGGRGRRRARRRDRSSTRAGRPGSRRAPCSRTTTCPPTCDRSRRASRSSSAGKDGVMCILPFFHSFGLVAMNFGIGQAGKLVLLPRFEVHMALKQLDKEKPSFFPGVPRLFVALNEAPETPKYDLKSVKACISGAAPLPRAVAEKFREVTGGANLVEGYGLTETSPVTHVNPFDEPKHGTIGLPIPDTDCRIVSLEDPDSEVPAGRARRALHQGARR